MSRFNPMTACRGTVPLPGLGQGQAPACGRSQSLTVPLLLVILGLALGLSACSKLTLPRLGFEKDTPAAPSVPLRVLVALDPSVQKAAIPYNDSCNTPRVLPLGDRLSEMLLADARQVFQEVVDRDDPSLGLVSDAVLQFALEKQDLDLYIPRREVGEYPARASLRVKAVLREGRREGGEGPERWEGPEIFSGSAEGTGKWTVTTDGTACEVEGVVIPVNDALEELSDQLVDQLRRSAQIQAAAVRLLARRQALAGSFPQPGLPQQVPTAGGAHRISEGLSFRVLLQDENRNRILEGGETVTMEVEVTNQGPLAAQGVMVTLSGTPALVEQFSSPVSLGALQAGERRQVTLTATLAPDIAEQQTELVVQITQASGLGLPPPKRFIAWVLPAVGADGQVEVLSVDVDHVPARAPGFERRNLYAVVVGIGTYRGERSPSVAYAERDAEVVARYLQAVAGIPESNVRVLTNEYAVLSDLREAFERWLPRHVKKDSIVLIYVVGKGVARTKTGEVSLLPYEGGSTSQDRHYPLAHLLNTLDQLPSKGALLFFDLSFAGDAGAPHPRLAWLDKHASSKGKAVLIASSGMASPAVQFVRGQHGLFTYYLLKGLRGGADTDRDGSVRVRELFRYLEKQLPEATRAEGQAERIPIMVPRVPAGSTFDTLPLGKIK